MSRTNVAVPRTPIYTAEGTPARHINPLQQLRRLCLACMLWEDNFYVDGKTVAQLIAEFVGYAKPEDVAALAIEAREKQKLRHVPLLLVRELARRKNLPAGLVRDTLARVIQRADELAEFLAIYWKDGKQPLSAQVKKGLAQAFLKFDEWQLSRYANRDGAIKMRDVLFLVHAKPKGGVKGYDKEKRKQGIPSVVLRDGDLSQATMFRRLAENELRAPEDTWEVALSAGEGKKNEATKRETWTGLLNERKLGALALLRNLRNMTEANVDQSQIRAALKDIKVERVLPFRFIAAARHNPMLEDALEEAMLKCLAGQSEKLVGRTVLLIDVSGSMDATISSKSELMRLDAATGVAMLVRELADAVTIYSFSDSVALVPSRRGFALRDAIVSSQPHGGTRLGNAIAHIQMRQEYERLIVITDEQSHDRIPNPTGLGYVINVGSERNGVGYGPWTHIDGWSEAVIEFIRESEIPPASRRIA